MAISLSKSTNKSSLNQILTLLAGVIVAVSFYGSYQFLLPQLAKDREQVAVEQASLSGLTTDVANLNSAQAQLNDAVTVLRQSGVNVDAAHNVVPLTEDMPSLYIQMESVINRMPSLSKRSYQLSNPTKDVDGSVKIPLTISAAGSYKDLKTFLESFEQNIRPASFSSIAFTPFLVTADAKTPDKLASNGLFTLNAVGAIRAQGLSDAYDPSK
jgi:Tfp pilus assembly protein PilO